MTEFAIYDMDRTITRHGTYTPWLLFWARHRAPWRLLLVPAAALCALAHVAGLISRARFKELSHWLLMGGRTRPERLGPMAEAYARRVVERETYREAIAQIASDRLAGRRVVLATASYAFYVEPIARRLGIAEVVATGSMRDDRGRVLARIDDGNCYGDDKLRLLQAWFARTGLSRGAAHVRFYSDHVSDRPVFEWADEPVAVNASSALRTLARQRGWRMIDWH